MKKDINKQPKWVQELIADKEKEIISLQTKLENLQTAYELLKYREWFTIHGPKWDNSKDVYHLWFLDRDQPIPACSLGKEDVLLVGRRESKEEV